ncbi:NUDIX domain-containing protein [Candidatus Pacearchaeota archaeon]|nr:NUDIX domain-containing protein [Candidatus Pacearchaeota archaeon]
MLKKLGYREGIFCVTYAKEGNKTKFLLLHRKLHWVGWEFPKGGIKKSDKNRKKTVAREIKEESGQKPLKFLKLGFGGKYDYKKNEQKKLGFKGQTFSSFLVKIKKGKIRLDKREHDGCMWGDYKNALKLLTWPNQKRILRIASKYISKLEKEQI